MVALANPSGLVVTSGYMESLRDGVEVLDGVNHDSLSQFYHNGIKA